MSTVPLPGSPGGERTAAVLRRLELDVARRLDGLLHGDHRGLVPGHGSEPGEARVYEPGDDVRRIDWNVTARTAVTHIRETIADRELECWILADRSASLDFGTDAHTKHDAALAVAMGVGLLAGRGGNRVGGLVVGSSDVVTVPPRQGRRHLLSLLTRIADSSSEAGAPALSLGAALRRVGSVARRRGLVVVISDFVDEPETWRPELAALTVRQSALCVEVVDRRELELPKVGILTLVDTETGRVREVDTRSRRLRDDYAAAATDHRAAVRSAIRGSGADHLRVDTDGDWLGALARHVLARRRTRSQHGAKVSR